jgi:Suppressor of fused protein (SUFU)
MTTNFKRRSEIKDYRAFYAGLFEPIERQVGKLDKLTITALVGFPMGGPVNLATVGKQAGEEFVTYASCELACYEEQQESSEGPFEIMVTSNDEDWARAVVTAAGQVSFEAPLDAGHTIDVGPILRDINARLQGLIFERFSTSNIGGRQYGILSAIGVTRAELDWSKENAVGELIKKLKAAGVYPRSDVRRRSVSLQ